MELGTPWVDLPSKGHMTAPSKKVAGALGGAVALAFGAYAIGSQADSGSALAVQAPAASTTPAAASTPPPGGPPFRGGRFGGPRLDDLAGKLGVTASALRAALQEVRRDLPARDPRAELAQELAQALNLSTDKVQAALDRLRGTRADRHANRDARRTELADALAKELGVDAAKVRSAFSAARPDRSAPRGPGRRAEVLAGIAGALGVSSAQLQAALQKVRGDLGPRDGRPHGDAAALAKALGVDTAKVQAALDKLRADHQADHTARQDALATALAKKLNLDVAKVKTALESTPRRFGGPGGRGGWGGFGGPGGRDHG